MELPVTLLLVLSLQLCVCVCASVVVVLAHLASSGIEDGHGDRRWPRQLSPYYQVIHPPCRSVGAAACSDSKSSHSLAGHGPGALLRMP